MFKERIIHDKTFYSMLLHVTIPITIQNLIGFLIQMLDTVMIGKIGDIQLSGVAQANQLFFLFTMVNFGLAGGATVLAAQYWGKKDIQSVKKIIAMVTKISMAISLFFFAAAFFTPNIVMQIFIKDAGAVVEGAKYLRIIGFSYLFYGFSSTIITCLRSVELVKISLICSIATLCVNGSLNWILIFGKFGAPALGVEGAALATLIARAVEFLISWIYVFYIDKRLNFQLKDFWGFDKQLFRDYIAHGMMVLINELTWAIGMSVQSIVLGQMGKDVVSANSINSVVQQLSTVAIFGLASAAAVIIGKYIGQRDFDNALRASFTLKLIAGMFGLLAGTIVYICRGFMIDFYSVSNTAKQLADQMITITSVVVVFISFSGLFIIGILRGAGDTKFSTALELLSMWLVSVPLALIMGLVLQVHPAIVYLCMKIDELIKALVGFYRTRNGHFMKDVTR